MIALVDVAEDIVWGIGNDVDEARADARSVLEGQEHHVDTFEPFVLTEAQAEMVRCGNVTWSDVSDLPPRTWLPRRGDGR